MNWLTNFVRPKIRALVGKRDTPDNLWLKCPACGQMVHHKAMKEAQQVCPSCDHHMRMGPKDRFAMLFDDGDYTLIELPKVAADPLKFRDSKRYADRLKENRAKTGQDDAMLVGHGQLDGLPLVAAAANFNFMGGLMGMGVGEAVIAAAQLALLQQAPLVVFSAAGGARMQEGTLSLMQMPRTTVAIQMVREKGLPFISVLTDPTTGGVTASYAMLGDINVAEPNALIGFAGRRVIEGTIREQLPEGFQRAEYLLEHGMLDMVVHRHRLRATLSRVLHMLCRPGPEAEVVKLAQEDLEIPEPAAPTKTAEAESEPGTGA
ncbi:MAG: acetyl-CoA carboxylase, carboxyltransferase subunit beta [Alphaproteobacteria bacterium]